MDSPEKKPGADATNEPPLELPPEELPLEAPARPRPMELPPGGDGRQPNARPAWQERGKRLWDRLRAETAATACETRAQLGRLKEHASVRSRRAAAEKRLGDLRLSLGEAACAAGEGDDGLRGQLAAIDERIRNVQAAGGKVQPLQLERRGVLLRLADDLMGRPEVPASLENASAAVRAAASELDSLQSRQAESRRQLLPADTVGKRRVVAGVAVPVLATVGMVALAWTFVGPSKAPAPVAADQPPATVSAGSPAPIASARDENTIRNAVGMVVCGLKVVSAEGKEKEVVESSGTAFAVTPAGHLITNKHVVEKIWSLGKAKHTLKKWQDTQGVDVTPTIWVFFGKEKYVAEVLHVSDDYDFSLLKVNRPDGPFFRLAQSPVPRGEAVMAFGFPGAARVALSDEEVAESVRRTNTSTTVEKHFKTRDFEFVLTSGVVSRTTSEEGGRAWVQHNAAINPGNSGGPLATQGALVVGINTLLHTKAEATYFALEVNQLRPVIDKLARGVVWSDK